MTWPQPLRTERLTLRPFRLRDAVRFVALAGDFEVARMTSDIPHPLHLWQSYRWLAPAKAEVRYAVVLDDAVIGGVGYFSIGPGAGELGFWLGQPYWGEGYGTEAARAVVDYAFGPGGLHTLTSANFVDNPASARILTKLGFTSTGIQRAPCRARGGSVDANTWVLYRPGMQATVAGSADAVREEH